LERSSLELGCDISHVGAPYSITTGLLISFHMPIHCSAYLVVCSTINSSVSSTCLWQVSSWFKLRPYILLDITRHAVIIHLICTWTDVEIHAMLYYHTEVSFINTYDGENAYVVATSNMKVKINTNS
jgi:hypothetical protein